MRRVRLLPSLSALAGLQRCASRHATTIPPSSYQAATSSMAPSSDPSTSQATPFEEGFSTPNFGGVSDVDMKQAQQTEVKTELAAGLSSADLAGPWILVCPAAGIQGELMVRNNGRCFFRPGNDLGSGVGDVTVQQSGMFELQLELYVYATTSRDPPTVPRKVTVAGVLMNATAVKENYNTLTMAGDMTIDGENKGQMNAAKMTPWDPSSEQPFRPRSDIADGFKQLFPEERVMKQYTKHVNLERYKVGPIDTVYYIPNFVSKDDEHFMLDQLKKTPENLKNKLEKRLVQEWGSTMCDTCNKSFVTDMTMPPWTRLVCTMLLQAGIFTPVTLPNNVRIHEYAVGEGIAPHVDGPIYVPNVAILSLASSSVMSFYAARQPYDDPMEHFNDTFRFNKGISLEKPLFSVVMEPRSLLIFRDKAYTDHPHGVSDKAVDVLSADGAGEPVNRHLLVDNPSDVKEVHRAYRVGVTVRNLLARCNHKTAQHEYYVNEAFDLYHHKSSNQTQSSSVPASPAKKPPTATSQFVAPTSSGKPTTPSASHPAKTQPPSQASTTNSTMPLEQKVDTVLKQQETLLQALREVQVALQVIVQSDQQHKKEVSQILDNMTTSMMNITASLADVEEKLEAKKSE